MAMTTKHIDAVVGFLWLAIASVSVAEEPICSEAEMSLPPDHFCSEAENINSTHCQALHKIKHPQWGNSQDLIILPHRFLWGDDFGNGPPENSEAAFEHLKNAGFTISEVDFTPLYEGGRFVLSHDYVVSRLTNASGSQKSWRYYEKDWDDIKTLKLRKRNGVVTDEIVFEGRRAIDQLTDPDTGILVFADLKQKPDQDPEQYARNWIYLVNVMLIYANSVNSPGSLSHFVFKTPFGPYFLRNALVVQEWFCDVNWMPQVASDAHYQNGDAPGFIYPVTSSAEFIDSWEAAAHSAVAAYETNYKSADDSRRRPFERDGVAYDNILDYIKQVSGYRGGVFAEEPVGPRGVVNRDAVWDIKDVSNDHRGEPMFEAVDIPYGNFIVVTTDRPDVWKQYQQLMELLDQ